MSDDKTRHDAKVRANIAAELARAWAAEVAARSVAKAARPEGEGQVPAERFGPSDRKIGGWR